MVLDTNQLNFGGQEWLQFHIWFIMTLYYKIRQILLQNATTILLQNVSSFLLQNAKFHYKIRQLLQNALILLQIATVVTKYDVHYKIRRYTLKRVSFEKLKISNVNQCQSNFDKVLHDNEMFWQFPSLRDILYVKSHGISLINSSSTAYRIRQYRKVNNLIVSQFF